MKSATLFTKGLLLALATAFSVQANAAYDQDLFTIPTPYGSAKLTCSKVSSGMIYVGPQDNIIFRQTTVSGSRQVEVAKIQNLYFENLGGKASMVLDIGEAQPLKINILGKAGEYSDVVTYHTELEWSSNSPVTNAGKLIQMGFDSCSFEVLK